MLTEAEAPRGTRRSRWRQGWWAPCSLIAISLAFRLPALLRAGPLMNSDSAVVGLQARHLLDGEWGPFLWGSGYQTSTDALIVAALVSVLGPTPLAVMLAALLLHVALTWLVFDTLRRALPRAVAFVATLPLVFCSSPSHTYILYPPRQAALTLAMAAVWVASRGAAAPPRARPRAACFVGAGALAAFALYADPYALVMLPAVVTFAALSVRTRADGVGCLGGVCTGILPYVWLRGLPGAAHAPFRLSWEVVPNNARLLMSTCLPWALGARAYVPAAALAYAPFRPGSFVALLQAVAGGSLLLLMLLGVALSLLPSPVRPPSLSWPLRRLGLTGGVALATALSGFLTSRMVLDLFSARYLASLILFAPFALAPLASRLGPRLLLVLAPALVASAWAAWMGFSLPRTSGPEPDERALAATLRARGVDLAAADYWASYRLTFLTRETLRVVPVQAIDDRYPPYRDAFRTASRVAYVFDPLHSVQPLSAVEVDVAAGGSVFGSSAAIQERIEVGGYQALVIERPLAPPP